MLTLPKTAKNCYALQLPYPGVPCHALPCPALPGTEGPWPAKAIPYALPESELAVHYPDYEGVLAALEHQGTKLHLIFFLGSPCPL